MFNRAIFGDNTTIVVGHENEQQVTNVITAQGDFAGLANELRRHGVGSEDIAALKQALAHDEGTPEMMDKRLVQR